MDREDEVQKGQITCPGHKFIQGPKWDLKPLSLV